MTACTCSPCESPAYGAPGIAHCAACCAGTAIEAYDHDCPIEAHRQMAVRQFGPAEAPTTAPTNGGSMGDNCAQVSAGCTICAINGIIHITNFATHKPTPGIVPGRPKWAAW